MNSDQAREILKNVRQIEIRTNRLVNDSMAGEYHSVFRGRGMDFDEVREYLPGDEVRTIDWNVTARAGRTFVKKFTEERELTTGQPHVEPLSKSCTCALPYAGPYSRPVPRPRV